MVRATLLQCSETNKPSTICRSPYSELHLVSTWIDSLCRLASPFILLLHWARWLKAAMAICNWKVDTTPGVDQRLTCNDLPPGLTGEPNEENETSGKFMPNGFKQAHFIRITDRLYDILKLLTPIANCSGLSPTRKVWYALFNREIFAFWVSK